MSFAETFLEYPDLFPARPSGEPWGECELSLDLPGGPYRLVGLSREQRDTARGYFSSVLTPEDASETPTELRVFRAPQSDFKAQGTRDSTLDFLYADAAVQISGWHLMGRLDWRPGLVASLWTPDDGTGLFSTALENLTRTVVAYRMLSAGDVLVHSSAAGDGRSAFLFVGPSGVGKSTLWRFCRDDGLRVFSDDLNGLYRRGGVAYVQSTPFSWEEEARTAPPVRLPLRAVLFLRQGSEPALRDLGLSEAVGRLFSASPFVNHDEYRREPLFDSLRALCSSVPTKELTFAKEPGLYEWLDRHLDRAPKGAGPAPLEEVAAR